MDTETGIVTPFHDHRDECVIDQAFLFQHLQHRGTEQFSKWLQIHFRHQTKVGIWWMLIEYKKRTAHHDD
jgi:hypothetical protein